MCQINIKMCNGIIIHYKKEGQNGVKLLGAVIDGAKAYVYNSVRRERRSGLNMETKRIPMDMVIDCVSGAHFSGWQPSTTSSSSPTSSHQPFIIGNFIISYYVTHTHNTTIHLFSSYIHRFLFQSVWFTGKQINSVSSSLEAKHHCFFFLFQFSSIL